MYSRRRFLKYLGCTGLTLQSTASVFMSAHPSNAAQSEELMEARYYKKLANRKIQCVLCPRECVIDDLERGYCGARENRGGTYYTLVYGKPCTVHIDPIEKKPLFHFLPNTQAFSMATAGCNVLCKFCQNWEISQSRPEQVQSLDLPPQKVARLAQGNGCAAVAYTYSEPVIFTEYMHDTAVEGRKLGIRSVMISNGYIKPEPMSDLCRVLDGVKIDLKGFTDRFYKELVNGRLQPVLDSLLLLKHQNMWLEIVYLLIPGQNDDEQEIKDLCAWIVNELGQDVPVHFTRFHPQYRLTNLPPTPIPVIQRARKIGLEAGLHYVYTGNVPGDPGESTYCPSCSKTLIRRIGFAVIANDLRNGQCPDCGTRIPGVWN